MKCPNCGEEIPDTAKFCGECGTKIEKKVCCPECGNELKSGAKFCPECGTKVGSSADTSSSASKETKKEAKATSPWGGMLNEEILTRQLDDTQREAVRSVLLRFKNEHDCDRLLVRDKNMSHEDNQAFREKFENFRKVVNKRFGFEAIESDVLQNTFAILDYGNEGTGRRATVFSTSGICVCGKEFPKLVDGEPRGGIIPWVCFYQFSSPNNEKSYCLWDFMEMLRSDNVPDEMRDELKQESADPSSIPSNMMRFSNTGLDADAVEELIQNIKAAMDGRVTPSSENEEEIGEEVPEEEIEEEEIIEEEEE